MSSVLGGQDQQENVLIYNWKWGQTGGKKISIF